MSEATPRMLPLVLVVLAAGISERGAAVGQGEGGADARIDIFVARTRSQHQIPGLALAVVAQGRRVYAKGFGTMSLTEDRPVTADTQFRLASVSKPFTAVAVLTLVERGRVDLDHAAREYCVDVQPLNGAPTVRHFLTHQSGMRHTTDEEDVRIKGPVPRLGAALSAVAREPLRFAPGARTLYTSWGYAALGCVIESVSGLSYAAFLKQSVLDPAGLADTAIDEPTYRSPRFSPGFRFRGGKLQASQVVDTRFKTPASGLISSVSDMARFAIALLDGTLLPSLLSQEMLTVPATAAGDGPQFSAGWTVARQDLGAPGFSYNGSMEGSTAFLYIIPSRRVAVALLANRERFVPEMAPLVLDVARVAFEISGR